MAIPTPKNSRINKDERCVDFEVDVSGRTVQAKITLEALSEYCNKKIDYTNEWNGVEEKIKTLQSRSYMTQLVVSQLKGGANEPVFINSLILIRGIKGKCLHCGADVQNWKVPKGDHNRAQEARESGIDPATGHKLDCSLLEQSRKSR